MLEKTEGRVLVVDDDEDVLLAARLLLKKHVALVHTEKQPDHIPNLLKNQAYDVILLDMNYSGDMTSGEEGFYWLEKILNVDPSAIVVMITAFGDVNMAVKAIKYGATDFILKPWQNEKLLATLHSAVDLRRSKLEIATLKNRQRQMVQDLDQQFHDIIGVSKPMQAVFQTINKVAATDANILILGENGTGKELVARALHRNSDRAGEFFVCVDMGAIPETLFESELFGYEQGAFTDAKKSRPGRFEVASGGTLFLDEIGNLPMTMQAKLLRVLEERQVMRIGANRSRTFDVRLICATNTDIHDNVARNQFRQDLLYRINTVELNMPPLRERLEDIPLLSEHFIKRYCRKYKKPTKTLSTTTLNKLQNYSWPGNVRELQHAMERAVIMSDSTSIQPGDFFFPPATGGQSELIFDSYNLEEVEKIVILKAVKKCRGNMTHAARELGLTRASLYRRLEKYGI